ncbi:hypothetical protein ACFLU6_04250 [Acidobacteriota bacterium]
MRNHLAGKLKKVQAYSSNMAVTFLAVENKYGILRPMIFNKALFNRYDQPYKMDGFLTLKIVLFIDATKDIVKVVFDKDHRSPSLYRIIKYLENEEIRLAFRESFSSWLGTDSYSTLKNEFDRKYKVIKDSFQSLCGLEVSEKLKDVRNKISAHIEMRKDGEGYRILSIGDLELEWNSLEGFLQLVKPIVFDTAYIVGNETYDHDSFSESNLKTSGAFWDLDVKDISSENRNLAKGT